MQKVFFTKVNVIIIIIKTIITFCYFTECQHQVLGSTWSVLENGYT